MADRLGSPKSLLSNDPTLMGSDSGYNPQKPQYQQAFGHEDFHKQNFDQPTFDRATFEQQPSYNEPTYTQQQYPSTFTDTEGRTHDLNRRPSISKTRRSDHFAFIKSKWPAVFMGITFLQAVICLSFEAYVFGTFQNSMRPDIVPDPAITSQLKIIPTFLTLFIFAFLYEFVIVWDALRMKNTIQAIGVCFSNLALVVYTAIQVDQILTALRILEEKNALERAHFAVTIFADIRPYLIAIPVVIALATALMTFFSWKLYQEFAWDILKVIGADYRMKKRFLHYQIYIALLKFDFFFFLGFIIQLVVIVTDKHDPEFALTIVTIPVTIVILVAAAWFTRKENKIGMIIVLVLYHGALTYFIFKLVRIYQPEWRDYYETVRKSLTAFAVITILLIFLTISNCILCLRNFDNGLKAHLISDKKDDENPDVNSVSLNDVKPQPSRMTID